MKRRSASCVLVALLVLTGCASTVPASPYAGAQARSIKALSEKEVADLLEGAGMGYAKAAELNRYPGPTHVLELSAALQLSPAQRAAVEDILERHKAEARALGSDVVRLERQLDELFSKQSPSPEMVSAATANLALVTGRLRASHLNAHIATTRLLTPAQIDRYVEARGYAGHAHH